MTQETPTKPLIEPAKSEEVRKAELAVEAAMRDPEVVAILQDPQVQSILGKLQAGQQHELDAAMRRDPGLVAKLRKLSQEPLDGIKVIMNEEDITDVCAEIQGPGAQRASRQH